MQFCSYISLLLHVPPTRITVENSTHTSGLGQMVSLTWSFLWSPDLQVASHYYFMTLILIHLSKCLWPLVLVFEPLLFSTHAILGRWSYPVTRILISSIIIEFHIFSPAWPLLWCSQLPTLHLFLCINRNLKFNMCKTELALLSSQIILFHFSKQVKSYFWFFFFSQTAHPINPKQVPSAPSFEWKETGNAYLSSTTRAYATIFSYLGLCQSLLTDYLDSTPSPTFLHRAAGILLSEFKLDNLVPLICTIQVNLITFRKAQVFIGTVKPYILFLQDCLDFTF